MADLKYIMDMEDDEDLGNDKYSRQPSLSGSARSPNPSSTPKKSDDNPPPSNSDLSKSQPRRRGLLSRSSKSTTTVSPAATASVDKAPPPSRSPLNERRSVDKTESMDPVGYGSYPHSSSSNMPPSSRSTLSSRPMTSAPGESSIPVKLTPITGRVSRAKKGVPVHICDTCKPPKTFTRAEHLRRHQLSHKPAAFQCPYRGCEKTFHRQDLLSRHTQRHEQDDRSGTDVTSNASRQTSQAPVERNPSMGILQAPLLPGNNGLSLADEIPTHTSYPGNASPYSTSQRGSISGQGPMSPSAHSSRSHSTSPQDDYILQVSPFGVHPSSMDGPRFQSISYGLEFEPRRSPAYPYMGLEGLPSLTIPDSTLPGHLSQESNWPSSASDSPYSTPDGAMIRGYDSPAPDVANQDLYYVPPYYHSPQQTVYPIDSTTAFAEDAGGYYEPYPQAFPVRSPTPPTVTLSAQPAENLVTVGLSVSNPAAILGRQKGPAALLSPYSDAAFLTALVPSPAALNAIPHYLDVYWKRFDVLFPLVHRRSLETRFDPILRCAMAAVGAQFLQSKEDRTNSHILHGLAWQEARRRPEWSIHVMQAILLCEFYSRFRGSRAVTRTSEPFQSLYSRVANSQTSADCDSSTGTSHRHWEEWIVTESRRRLLAACFVLDVHTSLYHEHSTLHNFLTPTPPIPLVKPTQHLWEAQDLEAWETLVNSDPAQLSPVSLADEEITADHVNSAPPLDIGVYIASEALRLPRRSPASAVDTSIDLDLDSTRRMCDLFPGSAVANTYLALHHTPLRDLLAVSGDSWLFSRKILEPEDFQRRKHSVRTWSGSAHAGTASIFAAKALLAFLTNANISNAFNSTETNQQGGEWNMSDISDYWALYVCALICWSIGQRTTRGAMGRDNIGLLSASTYNTNLSSDKAEDEAKGWLKMVASLSPETIQNVRGRREALGVVAMVRRRLENETVGGKSKLLVDAVRVLKTLEEEPNKARF
ncbi:fungal-specific transcription factor domain-containing protein [Xylaria flabelliformis]|nr:fungal-specific transcription factor domain-containing protein [Xylaria flabelliformis]